MSDPREVIEKSKRGDRTTTAVRFNVDLHQRLAAAASERDLSINFLVNRACEEFLDRLIPIDEMQWTRTDVATHE